MKIPKIVIDPSLPDHIAKMVTNKQVATIDLRTGAVSVDDITGCADDLLPASFVESIRKKSPSEIRKMIEECRLGDEEDTLP